MTIMTVDLSTLKRVKNSVIGNPTAKVALSKDEAFIGMLVDCINNPVSYLEPSQGSQDDIRIEAAHVISSLSYGSSDALKGLLRANAHQAFLYAISNFLPTDSPALKAAFARALRALAMAIAETVGPSQWGLRDHSSEIRNEARVAWDYLFNVEALDIYLPLLEDPSSQTIISISQLLASAIRSQPYRVAVSEWLPPGERNKEVKGKRGWEKPDTGSSPSRQGGWVARRLVALLQKKDSKLQEAALSALASLAKDNSSVAVKLARSPPDQTPILSTVLSLCKSRTVDLQLAACLCATSIIRSGLSSHALTMDQSAPMTVVHVMNSLISSESESMQTRTKACFILYNLVADDKDLCQLAFERGSLNKLGDLIKSITPSEPASEWDEDEPESISCLREAGFTAIAAIALFDNDIRCEVTDGLRLVPYIQNCLSHRHVGVRYSACQCARALSRAVLVLRTNMVDSGLGMTAFELFLKQDEDRRVMYAASAVVCNLVNDFSPLRTELLSRGLFQRLVQLLHCDDQGLRLNALWAFTNMLYKSNMDMKRRVVNAIGWDELTCLLSDPDTDLQERAFHILRHVADSEEGIEMIYAEIGSDVLLSLLSSALESENDDVLKQAVCLLGNLANSPVHQFRILHHPSILASLRSCLVDAKVEIRRPAASCIVELARNPRSHKELHEAGIDSTLRHMCDYGGGMSGSPTTRLAMRFQMGVEDDGEVKEKAREALHWLEHAADMSI